MKENKDRVDVPLLQWLQSNKICTINCQRLCVFVHNEEHSPLWSLCWFHFTIQSTLLHLPTNRLLNAKENWIRFFFNVKLNELLEL